MLGWELPNSGLHGSYIDQNLRCCSVIHYIYSCCVFCDNCRWSAATLLGLRLGEPGRVHGRPLAEAL